MWLVNFSISVHSYLFVCMHVHMYVYPSVYVCVAHEMSIYPLFMICVFVFLCVVCAAAV